MSCIPSNTTSSGRETECKKNFTIYSYYNDVSSKLYSTDNITPIQSSYDKDKPNITKSSPCSAFFNYEKDLLETRIDASNNTESYFPDGLKWNSTSKVNSLLVSNKNFDMPKYYLENYTRINGTLIEKNNVHGYIPIPFPTEGDQNLPSLTIPGRYTLQGNPLDLKLDFYKQYFIPQSPLNTNWTWSSFLDANPRQKIKVYSINWPTIVLGNEGTIISEDNIYDLNDGSSFLEELIVDNTIMISYDKINKYNLNSADQYAIITNSGGGPACTIKFPKIHTFEQPVNTVDTGILVRWSVSGTDGYAPLTMTLIGSSWWSDDIFGTKARRLSMLKLGTSKTIAPNNLITLKSDSNNVYVAPKDAYYKDWFKPNVMGDSNIILGTIPPSMNPYITIDIHIKIDDLNTILDGPSPGYSLKIDSITSLALLDVKNIFAQEAYSILNPTPSSSQKYGIYYTSLSSITKYTENSALLTTSQTSEVYIYGINMNNDSLSISYNTQNIENNIYSFSYKNYISKSDGDTLLQGNNYITTVQNKIYDMFYNKYNIKNIPIAIILNHKTVKQPSSNSIPIQLKNYYTDITIKTKIDSKSITSYDENDNINVFNNQWSSYNNLKYPTFYKNNDGNSLITNVFLSKEETKEQVSGALTYGDVYKLVHEWMIEFKTNNKKISYTDKPIHSSNIQFYNQPTGCQKDTSSPTNNNWKNCCNFIKEDSIYNCNEFSNNDVCGPSGPSAQFIYQKYMKQYNIGCVVGKPLVPKAAPAGGDVSLTDLLTWAHNNGSIKNNIIKSTDTSKIYNIYTSTTDGPNSAIMTWAIANYLSYKPDSTGSTVQINNVTQLHKRISPNTLSSNNTILYQYCDAFGLYGAGDMLTSLKDIIDGYTTTTTTDKKCWIVPILSFCDIGSDPNYVSMSTHPFDTIKDWWTSDKYTYLYNYYQYGTSSKGESTTPRNPYNLANPKIGQINDIGNYVVMTSGATGQWVNTMVTPRVNNANKIITTLGKPTNNMPGKTIKTESTNGSPTRSTKILLSFGGQNVSLVNTSILNTDILAQQLVNLVVKYAFDGIDFDLEGFSRKPSDIIWVTSLYGNVKKYFLGLEALIRDDNLLGYPSDYTFMITDAPQPAYFTPEYWGNVMDSSSPKSSSSACTKCIDSSNGCT
tara:strand:+ start:1112 stop:4558 length:3447 start_codon:yes stop_codon:yes gene_type:complete